MRIVCARYGLRGVRVGEANHPGPPKLVLRGVSQQSMVSGPSCIDPTVSDVLEDSICSQARVSDDLGVLKFDLTQADSIRSSQKTSAREPFSVFMEESEED